MNLEKHMVDYLDARERSGASPVALQEERRLLACYVSFCDERLLKPPVRCRFKALFMYRDWLRERPMPPDLQEQHLAVLFRLAAFVSQTPESVRMAFQKRDNRDKSGTGAKSA